MLKIVKAAEFENKTVDAGTASPEVEAAVSEIIRTVRKDGDEALFRYTKKFDGVELEELRVPIWRIKKAVNALKPEILDVIKAAAKNIIAFHKKQLNRGFEMSPEDGITLGQRVLPLDSAGIYVPGGTASYPSSVLMNAIPAKLAGVKKIVMVTPPGEGERFDTVLATAYIAGVDEVYTVGGAQAIAALAYGTESIPRVDKITGPGNIFVATAKKQISGTVAIDMIAGPSEICVVADESAKPAFIAADMLSQAEHDENASAILVTTSEKIANEVNTELSLQLEVLPRKDIARVSLENNGIIVLAGSIEEACEVSNEIAPEHLELAVDEPFDILPLIRHAGSVFLGHFTCEALGDYFGGPNHVLPTSGTARFSSPLGVEDFVKRSQYIYYDKAAMKKAADKVADFAYSEDLTAHARSAEMRG
jgi:histidinol dehydrogenase